MPIRANPNIEAISNDLTILRREVAAHTDAHPDVHADYYSGLGDMGLRAGGYTEDTVADLLSSKEPGVEERTALAIAEILDQRLLNQARVAIAALQMSPEDYDLFTREREREIIERGRFCRPNTEMPNAGTAEWRRVTRTISNGEEASTIIVRLTSTTLHEPGWIDGDAQRHTVETFGKVHHGITVTTLGQTIVNASVELNPLEDAVTMRLRRLMRSTNAYDSFVNPILRGWFKNKHTLQGYLMIIEGECESEAGGDSLHSDLEVLRERALAMQESAARLHQGAYLASIPTAELLQATTEQVRRLGA